MNKLSLTLISLLSLLFAGSAVAAPGYFPSGTPIYLADEIVAMWKESPVSAEANLAAPTAVQGTVTAMEIVPYESLGVTYFDEYYNPYFQIYESEPISGEFPRISLGDLDVYLIHEERIDVNEIQVGYELQVLCHPFASRDGRVIADCRLVGYSTPEDTENLTWQDMNTYIYLMEWNADHRDGRQQAREALERQQEESQNLPF